MSLIAWIILSQLVIGWMFARSVNRCNYQLMLAIAKAQDEQFERLTARLDEISGGLDRE